MPIGSILANFKTVKLSTADEREYTVKMNFITRMGVRIIGIPHIGFRIRARIILNLFKKIDKQSRILDAGCGYGIYSMILAKQGFTVDSVDIEKERINELNSMKEGYKKINAKIRTYISSLLRLPFDDEVFDVILCSDVIEHIKDDVSVFDEFYRVLKRGGLVLLTVPTNSEINKKNYKIFAHERPGYDLSDFQKISKDKGFKIEMVKYFEFLLAKKCFQLHYTLKNKVFLSLLFYFFYILSFLDRIFKIKESNKIVVLFRKI